MVASTPTSQAFALRVGFVILLIAQFAMSDELSDLLAAIDADPTADHARAVQEIVAAAPDLDVGHVARWIQGDPARRSIWGCELLRLRFPTAGAHVCPPDVLVTLLTTPDPAAQELGIVLLRARLAVDESLRGRRDVSRALVALASSQSARIHENAVATLSMLTGLVRGDAPESWLAWYRSQYADAPDLRAAYPRIELYMEIDQSGVVQRVNSTRCDDATWTSEADRHVAAAQAYDRPLRVVLFVAGGGISSEAVRGTVAMIKARVAKAKVDTELRFVTERATTRSLPNVVMGSSALDDLRRQLFVYGERAGLLRYGECLRAGDATTRQPVVVWVASRDWRSQEFEAGSPEAGWVADIVQEGVTVAWVRHGAVPYFTLAEAIEDVRDAVAHVVKASGELHVDPDSVFLAGYSSGGYLALAAALGVVGDSEEERSVELRRRLRGVMVIAAPVTLELLLDRLRDNPLHMVAACGLGTRAASGVLMPCGENDLRGRARQLGVRDAFEGVVPPILMLHGECDALVLGADAARVVTHLRERNPLVELRVISGCTHDLRDFGAARSAAIEWLSGRLGPK